MTNIPYLFPLPNDITPKQLETYHKNAELHLLACRNVQRRMGTLMQFLTDLGSQNAYVWDHQKFINVYPYQASWYNIAYGEDYIPSQWEMPVGAGEA